MFPQTRMYSQSPGPLQNGMVKLDTSRVGRSDLFSSREATTDIPMKIGSSPFSLEMLKRIIGKDDIRKHSLAWQMVLGAVFHSTVHKKRFIMESPCEDWFVLGEYFVR